MVFIAAAKLDFKILCNYRVQRAGFKIVSQIICRVADRLYQ
ncbi:hypothetical protein D1BOALGB6SA_7053 [Olavius sp. associated proteobacterium Delta 1]|nr:hypothetical protein D1BOALGB6SA_7053 [Olavius sp. associated proteobacterium Delta 1]